MAFRRKIKQRKSIFLLMYLMWVELDLLYITSLTVSSWSMNTCVQFVLRRFSWKHFYLYVTGHFHASQTMPNTMCCLGVWENRKRLKIRQSIGNVCHSLWSLKNHLKGLNCYCRMWRFIYFIIIFFFVESVEERDKKWQRII